MSHLPSDKPSLLSILQCWNSQLTAENAEPGKPIEESATRKGTERRASESFFGHSAVHTESTPSPQQQSWWGPGHALHQ